MAVRASGLFASLSVVGVPHVLASVIRAEVFAAGAPKVRISQARLEAFAQGAPTVRGSSLHIDALLREAGTAYATNSFLEVLVWSFAIMPPPVFPTLPGLAFSTVKRPKFFNGTATSASGREVNVAYANAPLWEWDLTYEYLPDEPAVGAATNSDLRALLGFYLAQGGSLQGFLFQDPDDHAVTGQTLGVTDG